MRRTRLRQGGAGPLAHSTDEALAKAAGPRVTAIGNPTPSASPPMTMMPVPVVPVTVVPVMVTPSPMPMVPAVVSPTPVAVMMMPTPVMTMTVMTPAHLFGPDAIDFILRDDGGFHAGRRGPDELLRRNRRQRGRLRVSRERGSTGDQGNGEIQKMSALHSFLPPLANRDAGRSLAILK